jgi:nicotinamidase-related amidase
MATKVSVPEALPKGCPCELPLERTALVIIDMQIDFLDPKGFGACLGNDVKTCHAIVPPCERLLSAWRKRGGHVLFTLEAHLPDLSDCPPSKLDGPRTPPPGKRIGDVLSPEMGRILIRGEPGNGIISSLTPASGEKVVHKPGKDMFYNTDVGDYLVANGITHLVFTGVTTEVCVQTSMRAANDRGYECVLIEDCTSSYFPEFKQSTIEAVRAQGGIIGWTAMSQDVIAAISSEQMVSSRL